MKVFSMFDLFGKYAYWKVIKYFALNPLKEVYVNELAKILNLSTGSCSQILRDLSLFGIFEKKMQVRAEVSAENGNVIKVNKPWWAFLASEPAE